MVTSVLELVAYPGKSDALCRIIEDDIRRLLAASAGFLEQVTLISEGEPHLVVLLTVWRTQTAAERYEQALAPYIGYLLSPYVDSRPRERAFQFAHEGYFASSPRGDDSKSS